MMRYLVTHNDKKNVERKCWSHFQYYQCITAKNKTSPVDTIHEKHNRNYFDVQKCIIVNEFIIYRNSAKIIIIIVASFFL